MIIPWLIDLNYLPDPFYYWHCFKITNQSSITNWYKLKCSIPNWSFWSNNERKSEITIGSIGAGASKTFRVQLIRDKPETPLTESGNIIVYSYKDSNYTDYAGLQVMPINVEILDLESWPDVQIWDFNDGTNQGWSVSGRGAGVYNAVSIEAGGYSIGLQRHATGGVYSACMDRGTLSVYKDVTLPDENRVIGAFYFYHAGGSGFGFYNHNFAVTVNDIRVWFHELGFSGGWYQMVFDLTEYKGQTVTFKIDVPIKCSCNWCNGYRYIVVDRILIAGK